MQALDAPRAPLSEDEHGVIRVGGTRVSLESVVTAFDHGASAEEIVERYPTLALQAVYATISYVLANRAAVDAYLGRRRDEVEALRREAEERFPAKGLRAQLMARRENAKT